MDIFVYPQSGGSFNLSSGKLVNNYIRATWVERYTKPSDFIIEAPLDSYIREEMPIGSLVSHIASDMICVVEDHEVVVDQDSDVEDTIRVSGRSFETILEHRIINSNRVWPEIAPAQAPYSIAPNYACTHARELIADHIDPQVLIDDNDALPNVNVWLNPNVSPLTGTLTQLGESIFETNDVYEEALKLLGLDGLGICTRRPRPGVTLDDGRDPPSRYEPYGLTICIYPGYDRTRTVAFSHAMGDVKKANYLFSNRLQKTSCLVHSRYYSVMVHGPQTGYNRRVMQLEAKDLDEAYDEIPGFAIGNRIREAMVIRGRQALAAQNVVSMSNVEMDEKDLTFMYRVNYGLGDLVSVHGDYQASTTLQVTEHVEIQDENGYTAYPTLSEPPEGGYIAPA